MTAFVFQEWTYRELDDLDSCITDSLTLMEEKDQGMTEEDVDYAERLDVLRGKIGLLMEKIDQGTDTPEYQNRGNDER